MRLCAEGPEFDYDPNKVVNEFFVIFDQRGFPLINLEGQKEHERDDPSSEPVKWSDN